MSDAYRNLGSVTHEADSNYLSPGNGFLKGERIPPGRYRVKGHGSSITFELRGEPSLTNAVYIPECKGWPEGEYELEVYWLEADNE